LDGRAVCPTGCHAVLDAGGAPQGNYDPQPDAQQRCQNEHDRNDLAERRTSLVAVAQHRLAKQLQLLALR